MAKLELRTHHIRKRQDGIGGDFHSLGLPYKIGIPSERARSRRAIQKANKAVKNGNYIDIGETPDIVCHNCLHPFCPNSWGTRSNNPLRRAVYEAVTRDPQHDPYSLKALLILKGEKSVKELELNLVDRYFQTLKKAR